MFPLTLNALVFDPQIFVCVRTWLTKHRADCMQLAAGFFVACGCHNPMRTPSMAIGVGSRLAWARIMVMPAIGGFQQVNVFSTLAGYGTFVTLTNVNKVSTLVFQKKIFGCSRTWITKHRVVCVQLAELPIVACVLHNCMRIPSMAIGVGFILVWTRTKVLPAIRRLHHVNYFAFLAADGVTEGLTNSFGDWVV